MAGLRRRFRLLLIITATALLGCRTTASVKGPPDSPTDPAQPPWESGSFARLPLVGEDDLENYVSTRPHESAYEPLETDRERRIEAMFDALQTVGIGPYAKWCSAVTAACNAGYQLGRFFDLVSHRWFIVGADVLGSGQAYFFINPEPRRLLVIEAPHVYDPGQPHVESGTGAEGARLLRETNGWALLINGADRCQGDATDCKGTFTSDDACAGYKMGKEYRESDVAHNLDNAFHVLHRKFTDVASASAVFVQLHGNVVPELLSGGLSVSDSRKWSGSSGIATAFTEKIQTSGTVLDCTTGSGVLCGYQNVQGRYTNKPSASPADVCTGSTIDDSGGTRFLHLEQGGNGSIPESSLISNSKPVSEALQEIVPCTGGNCSALPKQVFVPESPNVCPQLCVPSPRPDLQFPPSPVH